jgi:hypothetical protein
VVCPPPTALYVRMVHPKPMRACHGISAHPKHTGRSAEPVPAQCVVRQVVQSAQGLAAAAEGRAVAHSPPASQPLRLVLLPAARVQNDRSKLVVRKAYATRPAHCGAAGGERVRGRRWVGGRSTFSIIGTLSDDHFSCTAALGREQGDCHTR